ncbi:hypothetical protein [Noviherbaspirillum sp. Root189]|uniref:hypothetical protein n=1 Tax=Noviherbaspirillum sp. Root189 TaxID=1736487 RepID=UPI0012E3EB98|nr:hypothetical protein [Noviherbaspirillum sp. Root189]
MQLHAITLQLLGESLHGFVVFAQDQINPGSRAYTHPTFSEPAFCGFLVRRKPGTFLAPTSSPCTFLNQEVCMLTATYATIAIATEQDKTRNMLCRLQQYVETAWNSLHNLDLTFIDTAFGKLTQFDRFFRTRKIELYVIPSLRGLSRDAEIVIAELDSISVRAATTLRTISEQITNAVELGSSKATEICHSMQLYCRHLDMRLEKEEKELMPLARRMLSVEQWFSIAAQLLSEQSGGVPDRRRRGEISQSSNGFRHHGTSANLH